MFSSETADRLVIVPDNEDSSPDSKLETKKRRPAPTTENATSIYFLLLLFLDREDIIVSV